MTLLNAFLGYFAVLGSVPVIIHLLNRRRFKVVVWAAMEFLLATIQKNSRRLQLRDIVLMLLRAFALVFLALAMARPTLAPGGFGWLGREGGTAAVFILDNSLSMGYLNGRESRFDAAKRMARGALEGLPRGSSAALVLMSDVAVEEVPELTHDLVFVGSEIGRAQLSDGGTSVLEGLEAAWRILSRESAAAREIYLVTDVQQNSWPSPDDPRWAKLLDSFESARPRPKLFVLNAGDGMTDNVSIDSLAAADDLVSADSTVAFTITLRNNGRSPAEDVSVDLYVGETPLQAPRKAASAVVERLEAVHTVRLEARFERGGDCRVEARISPDRLAADDSRYLALNVLQPVRVLAIDGEPAEADDPFSGETGFLQAALSPVDPEDPEGRSLFDTEVSTVYGLGGKNLRDYGAVVLANVAEIPPGLADSLRTFVRAEGRGLVVFLGDNVNPRSYNELLFEKAGLLPGRLGASLVQGTDQGFGLATEALDHPIVSFFAPAHRRHFLAAPRFTSAFRLELPRAAPAAPAGGDESGQEADSVQVVARFTTGEPAIVERTVGRGSVVLFASSADREWTDFPLRPAYLPVVRRTFQHAALGRRTRKTVAVHERLFELLGPRDAGTRITVRDPRGGTRQVSAELAPGGAFARVEVSDTHFAGFYELAATGPQAAERHRVSYFAANSPRTESALDAFTEAELRARYPRLDFRWVDRTDDARRTLGAERTGREIWPVLLALVVACLASESVLALRWAPKEK